MANWLILLVIGLPWLGALIVWLARDKRPRFQNFFAVGFSVLAAVAALALLTVTGDAPVLRLPLGSILGDLTFVPDGLGVLLAIIATVIGSLAVIFSMDYMRDEKQLGRYYVLVLLFIGAMAGMALTDHMLLLFFFWEIMALCSYALISFENDNPAAVAGGIKALVVTQLGGIGLLAGTMIAHSYTGSYQISVFLQNAHTLPVVALTVIAFGFLVAAAAKSAQVPFHTWLPDAMEAPTPVSALIHAATMVNAGIYLLARFYPAFAPVEGWSTVVAAVGVVSLLLAGFMAITAMDLKRVLAFSTISQLGYMVYAVGVGNIYASQFHLLSHAVFKALLFLAAGAVIHTVGTRDLAKMGGLGKKMPFVRNVFIVGALALAGLPPLNGFWSKEMILETPTQWWLYLGVLIGVGLTGLYTLRMVWLVFFGEPRADLHAHDAPAAMRVSLGLLAVGAVSTWLLAGPLAELMHGTLPFHDVHALSTGDAVTEVLTAPVTLLALVISLVGMGLWWWRAGWMAWLTRLMQPSAYLTVHNFGFEWINTVIRRATRRFSDMLSVTQTGQLNWNMVGIVGGLIIVLAILIWRG